MQKIQFYLLPNRIVYTTDLIGNGFVTEYRKVYQRKIKLYKGISNTIEVEVRNSAQQRIGILGQQVVLQFFDAARQCLFTAIGDPIAGKTGLLSVTVNAEQLEACDPQMITVAAFLRQGTQQQILYADGQFDLLLQAEILDGFNPITPVIEELTVFNWEHDRKQYVSEIGSFGRTINDDLSTLPVSRITAQAEGMYQGFIQAEVTQDASTSYSTKWTRIFPTGATADWNMADTDTVEYSGDWRFIRFKYGSVGMGVGATFNIVVENNQYHTASVINRGQNYAVGDLIVIPGSRLGGDDSANNLTLRVLAVNEYPLGSIDSAVGVEIVSGAAAVANGYYRNIVTTTNRTRVDAINKIILRD